MVEVNREFVRNSLPVRDRNAHKGVFGKVHILAGSVGFTGAPVFAASAAVRTGSGLVFLSVPEEIWPVAAVRCSEAMPSPVAPFPTLLKKMNDGNGVLIGPGLGRSRKTDVKTQRLVARLQVPLVLDADGINAISEHIDVLESRRAYTTVLTPHEGEFLRLTGESVKQEDRVQTAQRFSQQYGCVLVLKGHRTVTAFPDGEVFLNATGNPGMAKGGSGDVLAGMILSLVGQGIPVKQAVPSAVWLHGRAGDLAAEKQGEYGMTPSDLLDEIPAAILDAMQ